MVALARPARSPSENRLSHLLDFREPYREQGIWWLPDNPSDEVAGTLTFNQDEGALLALVGMFGTIKQGLAFNREDIPVVHGVTMKGKRITLLRCMRKSGTFNFPGVPQETYKAMWLLSGYHASGSEECLYASSDLRFDGIEQWLGHRRFGPKLRPEGDFPYVMAKLDRTVLASLDDFTLTTDALATFNSGDGSELTARSESFVSIDASEPKSLSWHFSVATKLQSLASLCAGKNLPLCSVRLKGPLEKITDDDSAHPDIDLLVQMIGGNTRADNKRGQYVLTSDTLLSHSPDAIGHWYSAYEQISPALNLYFALTGYNNTYANARFVLSVQAIEVYHRRTSADSLVGVEEYTKLVEALTAAIPPETPDKMKDKIESTLEYSNEPTLGQRIRSIVKPLKPHFGKNPVGMTQGYISQIVATRNYNTHYSEHNKAQAFTGGSELHWATRRLVTLLTIVLLRHIGVPGDTLHEAMKRNQEFALLLTSEGVPPL